MAIIGRIKKVQKTDALGYVHNYSIDEDNGGTYTGNYTITNPNTGIVISETNYIRGRQHGRFYKKDKQGQKISEGSHWEGRLHGTIKFYECDELSFTIFYLFGRPQRIELIGRETEKYKRFKQILKL